DALSRQLGERIRKLDGLASGQAEHGVATGRASQLLEFVQRVLPGDLAEAASARAPQRCGHAVGGVKRREGEPTLVAEPALVDLRVVSRQDALDLALPGRRGDVAADRTEAADG